jgi:putative flippase GtrA
VAVKNRAQKAKFIVVGGANTAIDFGVLFTLKMLGLPAIPANVISTSCAFIFSFFANKKYTFKGHETTNLKREIFLFVIITLFGLWGLQTGVIWIVTALISGFSLPGYAVLFIAKILATSVSLTWNYIMYSRIVFKNKASS